MTSSGSCQSCGMPLRRDPQGGGTEAGGARSVMYCSLCYVDGKFTRPSFTVAEMQALVRDKMVAMGFPRLIAHFFTRRIPKLERWSGACPPPT